MAIALEDRLLVLTLFAGAAFLLPVLIAGVVWPRFLAWMAHLTTIVAGFLLIVALVFGALEYRKYRSEQRAHRAALSGLTASDLRYPVVMQVIGRCGPSSARVDRTV
jgi:hypothetical protein